MRNWRWVTGLAVCVGLVGIAELAGGSEDRALSAASGAVKYEATLESLNTHALPEWYADAKLGIFIHWGLYSVPGWAVLTPEAELQKLSPADYLKRNPYAEWY